MFFFDQQSKWNSALPNQSNAVINCIFVDDRITKLVPKINVRACASSAARSRTHLFVLPHTSSNRMKMPRAIPNVFYGTDAGIRYKLAHRIFGRRSSRSWCHRSLWRQQHVCWVWRVDHAVAWMTNILPSILHHRINTFCSLKTNLDHFDYFFYPLGSITSLASSRCTNSYSCPVFRQPRAFRM